MKEILLPFIIFLISMLVVDSVWLGMMVKRFYSYQIGHLMAASPDLVPAFFFYLIYVLGVTILVVNPALTNSWGLLQVFLMGAVYGLATYGTYDLTNHATLKDWPALVTIVDIIWGTLLTGTLSATTVYFTRMLQQS